MSVQRHVVIIPREDGGYETHGLKDWLRKHPDKMPLNLDPDPGKSNSHQLRAGLRKVGWAMEETPFEIRLKPPSSEELTFEEILGIPTEPSSEPEEMGFALEHQLRDFLADNIQTIEVDGRRLSLYKDGRGDGVEYSTPVGFIDILAVDSSGALFVFELKRAKSPDHAVGQLARYMGWVKETIGKNKEVFGVIVAKGIGEKLRFARSAIPNVYLFEYQVSFKLNQAHDFR